MSIPATPQVSCQIDRRFVIRDFIERLAIQRDFAKLATRYSRDLRLDQLCAASSPQPFPPSGGQQGAANDAGRALPGCASQTEAPGDDIKYYANYHSVICADSRVVKGIIFMSSKL